MLFDVSTLILVAFASVGITLIFTMLVVGRVVNKTRGDVINAEDLPYGRYKIMRAPGSDEASLFHWRHYVVIKVDERDEEVGSLKAIWLDRSWPRGSIIEKSRSRKKFDFVVELPEVAVLEAVEDEEAPAAFRKLIPEKGDDAW